MDNALIATRLKALRGSRTQKDVAGYIGVGQSTYAMYETGERVPSDGVKMRIAQLYRRSVQSIFFKGMVTESENEEE